MRAADHTQAMLDWWAATGVDRVDLAVRRASGAMLWQRDRPIARLSLAWARAENAQQADIYLRPERGRSWPLIMIDDVALGRADAVAREVDALLVETSPAGGCHVWLRCDRALAEDERRRVQRTWLVKLGGDPGSVSGEHLGRLAGFKNWKRGGCWVNVRPAAHGRPWVVVVDRTITPPARTHSPHAPAGQRRPPRHHPIRPRLGLGLYTPGARPRPRRDLCATGRPRQAPTRRRCRTLCAAHSRTRAAPRRRPLRRRSGAQRRPR